ncbi:hypothetical protein F8388_019027 [Cannabis sativa]|uniref:peroxidase n=1 Tax=Cannabis sativa TaxID=3483 RepID=A0A7J6H1S8_CANSA|nr:hypothetical protein F8388_019027 [Cannabis sativa]
MSVPYFSSTFSFIALSIIMVVILSSTSFALAKPSKQSRPRPHRHLSVDYYAKSCPQLEQLVSSVTAQQFKESPISGPATIRLFFHDCFVEGCDASILITSRPGSKILAEKDAVDNKDLREEGFESIRLAKALVETKCPGVVSCADILAIAARDYVHSSEDPHARLGMKFKSLVGKFLLLEKTAYEYIFCKIWGMAGGPYYQVTKGRWDGKISMASRVSSNIPQANHTVDQMLKLFNSKGLALEDLVVLSGAHTMGFAHCQQFVSRLYDYRGSKQPDPAIDPKLLKALRMYCPHFGGNSDIVAPFDVTTPFSFDHAYYGNLESNLGLLASDQALFLDPRTRPLVKDFATDKQKFFQAFGLAMEKMGSIGVKRGRKHGEKRKDFADTPLHKLYSTEGKYDIYLLLRDDYNKEKKQKESWMIKHGNLDLLLQAVCNTSNLHQDSIKKLKKEAERRPANGVKAYISLAAIQRMRETVPQTIQCALAKEAKATTKAEKYCLRSLEMAYAMVLFDLLKRDTYLQDFPLTIESDEESDDGVLSPQGLVEAQAPSGETEKGSI